MEQTDTKKALGNLQDFDLAVREAQLTGLDHLEVTTKLFEKLTKGAKTNYLTWGSPGLKIYPEGTMAAFIEEEKMDAEAHREMTIKSKKK